MAGKQTPSCAHKSIYKHLTGSGELKPDGIQTERKRERVEEGEDQAGTGRIYDAKIPLPYLELKCCGMLSLAATFYARRSTFCVLRLSVARCPLPVDVTSDRPTVRPEVCATNRPSLRPSVRLSVGCQFHFAQHFSSCCLCEKF